MGIPDQFVDTFITESEELLEDIELAVLLLEQDPGDTETLNRVFRAMHTIKGSGAMFGFDKVASFAHHLETLLDQLRNHKIALTVEIISLILSARDHVSALIKESSGGPEADTGVGDEIVKHVSDILGGSTNNSTPAVDTPVEIKIETVATQNVFEVTFAPKPELFQTGNDPRLLLEELRSLGECKVTGLTDRIPRLVELDPEQCYLYWGVTINTQVEQDAIKDVFIFVEDLCDLSIQATAHEVESQSTQLAVETTKADEAPEIEVKDTKPAVAAEVHTEKVQKAEPTKTAASANETLRVDSERLDTLVNLVGELVINQAQLAQIAARIDDPSLAVPVEIMERLTSELRDVALGIRMMPIGTTFSRFKRLVRDLSLELHKQVSLETDGAETELDKTVIDRLADPLVHLIRNSIDHGIELPDLRVANGKEATGIIRLSASHRGTSVVISISDDGKGLDADAIKRKAIENGLIQADDDLTESQINALVFAPGFSTASKVTSVSGRGVGMDVVKREIDALRGTIRTTSKKGVGTTIDLSLPLTLAIIEGLLIDVADERFVVPLSMVEECLELTAERYALSPDRNVIQVRGEPVPFVRLREVLKIQGTAPALEETVVVNVNDTRLGIVVDKVVGHHQTVIKSLGNTYKDVDAVSGATILGDGKVALILDILGLLDIAQATENHITASKRDAA